MIVRIQVDRRILQNEVPLISQNDSHPITFYLLHDDETVFDLTGYTASFKMREFTSSGLTINSSATVTNAVSGVISYTLTTTDTQTSGLYLGELEVLETSTNNFYSSQLGKILIHEEI